MALILIALITLSDFISSSQSVIVTTPVGRFKGNQIKAREVLINRFLGIPYAAPPVGNFRFKRAVPCPEFLDVNTNNPITYDATQYCDLCIQDKIIELVSVAVSKTKMSENCLCLNIWTPVPVSEVKVKDADLLPVSFYIHGGGFFAGSGSHFPGTYLAAKGTVTLTVNYRLGALGFFHSGNDEAPGNQGLSDQILALKWVNENIKYFGGDAKRITIWGQSAGAISVSDLMASPLTTGLFNSAIMMTGSIFVAATFGSSNQLLDHSIELAIQLKCADEKVRLEIPDLKPRVKGRDDEPLVGGGQVGGHIKGQGLNNQTMECLRKLSPLKFILSNKGDTGYMKRRKGNPFKGSFAFHPMGDDDILTSHSPLEMVNISMSDPSKRSLRILIGATNFEGGFFKFVPVTKALAKKYKNSSNKEWKNMMRQLIKGEISMITDEGVEEIITKYFDLGPGKPGETNTLPNGTYFFGINTLSDWHIYNLNQYHGDLILYCPTFLEAELRSTAEEGSVHAYYFKYSTNMPWKFALSPEGVTHGLETPYFFGAPFHSSARVMFSDQDRFVSEQVMNIITRFFYGQDLDWPKYESIDRATLSIGSKFEVIKQPNSEKCQILNHYLRDFLFN